MATTTSAAIFVILAFCLNDRQGLPPKHIIDQQFYSRRLLAALARCHSLDWRGWRFLRRFDRLSWLNGWSVPCAPSPKYMFLRHLSSVYRIEDISPCAFDSEHTSYLLLTDLDVGMTKVPISWSIGIVDLFFSWAMASFGKMNFLFSWSWNFSAIF